MICIVKQIKSKQRVSLSAMYAYSQQLYSQKIPVSSSPMIPIVQNQTFFQQQLVHPYLQNMQPNIDIGNRIMSRDITRQYSIGQMLRPNYELYERELDKQFTNIEHEKVKALISVGSESDTPNEKNYKNLGNNHTCQILLFLFLLFFGLALISLGLFYGLGEFDKFEIESTFSKIDSKSHSRSILWIL